jgi:hypothetical protein
MISRNRRGPPLTFDIVRSPVRLRITQLDPTANTVLKGPRTGRDGMKQAVFRWFVGLATACASLAAQAQTPYFQGRQVRVLVGFSPGGGTDLFGRVAAEGLARHLAGKPSVSVQNMPGAGSVVASNFMSQRAPRDGTTLLIGTGQLLFRILLGLDGAKSRPDEFEPIIASPMGRITYAATSAGLADRKALLAPKQPLVLGVPEVIATIDAVLGLKVLDVKFRSVFGYPGKNETRLALQQGEVNLDGQTTPLYDQGVKPLVAAGKAEPIFAQGLLDGENLVRDPAAMDIPTVAEVYREIHGRDPEGPAWEAYKSVVRAIGNGGKILMMHADAPAPAREALLQAAREMASDPEYLKTAEKVLEGYPLQTGDRLRANIAAVGRTTPETVAWLKDYLAHDFDMKFK